MIAIYYARENEDWETDLNYLANIGLLFENAEEFAYFLKEVDPVDGDNFL